MDDNIERIAMIMGKMVGGGVESVILNYFKNIDKSKFQFDFICDEDSTYIPYEEIEKLGGRVILVPPYQKVFKYHYKLKKVLKEGKYRIVHSNINTLSIFSLFAAWCVRIPVRIAHNHATSSKVEWKRNIVKSILKPFNRIFANVYMACSKSAGIWMFGQRNYNKNKIIILNNAIDSQKFVFDSNIRKKYRKMYNIRDNEIAIGQVGRIMQTKNQMFSLEIFEKINQSVDSKLIFVGKGIMENELKEKVKEKKLDNKVIFMGQIPNIHDVYNMFDVLLLPSLYEGFGMVLVEAQVSNLACIASKGVPIDAKISDNVFFIDLSEKEKWVSAINEIYTSERKDNSILIKDRGFDIKNESEKLENIYLNLLKGVK